MSKLRAIPRNEGRLEHDQAVLHEPRRSSCNLDVAGEQRSYFEIARLFSTSGGTNMAGNLATMLKKTWLSTLIIQLKKERRGARELHWSDSMKSQVRVRLHVPRNHSETPSVL